MQIHLLYVSNEQICTGEAQILLVGYIRGLSNKPCNGIENEVILLLAYKCIHENKANDIEIPEEDKSIMARASLDLPEFGLHTCLFAILSRSFLQR
ncbi:unnamed protein product [Camellia sinensis]